MFFRHFDGIRSHFCTIRCDIVTAQRTVTSHNALPQKSVLARVYNVRLIRKYPTLPTLLTPKRVREVWGVWDFFGFPFILIRVRARGKRTNCLIVLWVSDTSAGNADTDWTGWTDFHWFCQPSADCCAGKHRLGDAKNSENQSDLPHQCLKAGYSWREHRFRFDPQPGPIVNQWFRIVNRWFRKVNVSPLYDIKVKV